MQVSQHLLVPRCDGDRLPGCALRQAAPRAEGAPSPRTDAPCPASHGDREGTDGRQGARRLGRPLLSARRGLAPFCTPLSAEPGGRGGRGSPCGAASRAEGLLAAPIRCRGRKTLPSGLRRALLGGLGSVPRVPSKVGCGGGLRLCPVLP